jgi:hypothetical protein
MTENQKTEITLREVYDALMDLKLELSGHPWQIKDHEKRIRELELRVWTASGLFSGLSIVVSIIINLVTKGK